MSNYLLVFHGGGMPETEEAQAQAMAAWDRWYGELGTAVVDSGNPVGQIKTLASNGAVSDGGGANPASGYSIISADSIDDAVKLAMGCPVRESGGSVEVAETFSVM
jgi:hypothetical protein